LASINPITTLAAGTQAVFKAANSTTATAPTIALDGLAAKAVQQGGQPLVPNAIQPGASYIVEFDGTYWQLIGAVGGNLLNAVNENYVSGVASAATVDLGIQTGNYIQITGTTTITSFGSTGQAGQRRTIVAAGAFTITNSANILIGGGSYTTSVGDVLTFNYEGAGVWRQTGAALASGGPLVAPGIRTVQMVATSTTLAVYNLYVSCQMTAIGQSVTLPSAVSGVLGGPDFIIDNTKGAYPVGIRNNAGTLLGAVAAGGQALVSLQATGTQAGVWSITGSGLEPGLMTYDTTLSLTYSTPSDVNCVLSANLSMHFVTLASGGVAAFLLDNITEVATTPVTITATASSQVCAAFPLTATTALVLYGASATDNHAVVISVTGSVGSYGLSVGTPQALTATMQVGQPWNYMHYVNYALSNPFVATLVAGSLYLAVYQDTTSTQQVYAVAIGVSGTTVTIGTPLSLIQNANLYGEYLGVYPITASTATVIYNINGTVGAVVVSVSGTTCSKGTAANSPTGSSNANGFPACQLSSGTIVLGVDGGSGSTISYAITLSTSGTTVTWGTALTIESSMVSFQATGASECGWTVSAPPMFPITATTCHYTYTPAGSNPSRSVVLTNNSGTLTAGTIMFGNVQDTGTPTNQGYGIALPPTGGNTAYLSLKQGVAVANGVAPYIMPSQISGTTITYGSGRVMKELPNAIPSQGSAAILSNGDYVFVGQPGASAPSLAVVRTNGVAVNFRGTISVPPLEVPAFVFSYTPAVAANRVAIFGQTYDGTAGSKSVTQPRLLNVEIAA
jgi:hypothetical protein